MDTFLSTFVFIIPGIMAYFWLQAFGLNPPVKHTASEVSGIAAILWLPISFATLFLLNMWGKAVGQDSIFSVEVVWNLDEVSKATSDIRYLLLFLLLSALVSFVLCFLWSKWGHLFNQKIINKVRKNRKLAPLSSSATVWEEFFIKISSNPEEEENKDNKKEAVYIVYKVDKPEEFIIGSMTKASRPFETEKSLVLEDVDEWHKSLEDYAYLTKRVYVNTNTGMVVKEIDYKNPIDKPIPDKESVIIF